MPIREQHLIILQSGNQYVRMRFQLNQTRVIFKNQATAKNMVTY